MRTNVADDQLHHTDQSDGQRCHQSAFRRLGTSARRWALANGYRPRTVYRVLEVWVGRTDRPPLGGISREIVEALRRDLGADVVPLPGSGAPEIPRAGDGPAQPRTK